MSELKRFLAYVELRWDAEGSCRSCGWHAAMYEHGPFDEGDLPDAADIARGFVRWVCRSKDDDDPGMHRGVRISLDGWQPHGHVSPGDK